MRLGHTQQEAWVQQLQQQQLVVPWAAALVGMAAQVLVQAQLQLRRMRCLQDQLLIQAALVLKAVLRLFQLL